MSAHLDPVPQLVDGLGADEAPTLRERSLQALELAFELAHEQLQREEILPQHATDWPEALRAELGLALTPEGRSLEEVVGKLRRILAATPSSASRRFFNQLFGGRVPVATLAEMLTPLLNTSMYTYKVAGPHVLIEREVVGRMAAKVGYTDGEGVLSPGGSLSNLLAMMVGRNEALDHVRDEGLRGERATVYTSCHSHYSIRRNAGILGLGRHSVRELPVDPRGRMDTAALRRAVRDDRAAGFRPLLVCATAGTTVLGAFDPLAAIARVCRDEDLWLHVDASVGGSFLLCSEHRHLLEGAELSDSCTWNPHKLMGVPLSCSAVLFRRRGLLARHVQEAADYLFQAHSDELNPGTRSLQCGRRNDALKLWAAWQLFGDNGYDRRLRRLIELARYAAGRVDRDPDLELIRWPESINVCFEAHGASSQDVCDRLYREGRLLVGHAMIDDRCAIRLACVNADLERADIDAALDEIKKAAECSTRIARPPSPAGRTAAWTSKPDPNDRRCTS